MDPDPDRSRSQLFSEIINFFKAFVKDFKAAREASRATENAIQIPNPKFHPYLGETWSSYFYVSKEDVKKMSKESSFRFAKRISYFCVHHFVKHRLKVLSSEMDLAESSFIRQRVRGGGFKKNSKGLVATCHSFLRLFFSFIR
jgi:hypothetical protein